MLRNSGLWVDELTVQREEDAQAVAALGADNDRAAKAALDAVPPSSRRTTTKRGQG